MSSRLLRDLSEVTPQIAGDVLAFYLHGDGRRVPTETLDLLSAIAKAGIVKRALLAGSYPGEVKAVYLASAPGGIERLRQIARGDS